MEDLHVHVLASRESSAGRETLRVDYLPLLLSRLTSPLQTLPKDEAVSEVVDFMNSYSISQEDFDTILELGKFKVYTISFFMGYHCHSYDNESSLMYCKLYKSGT
jgi:replication factor C subunit 1